MVWFIAVLLLLDAQAPQRTTWGFTLNGAEQGDVLLFLRAGETWIPTAALETAGLRGIRGRREMLFDEEHVLLESLAPAVTFVRDDSEIRLDVTAAPSLFALNEIPILPDRPAGMKYASSPSLFLNYGAHWQDDSGMTYQGELGASAGAASFITGVSADDHGVVTRGLSTLTIDAPRRRQRLMFGDVYDSSSTQLGSRPVVLGGRFGRDYSTDPYFLPYANPSVVGSATLPSRADIYVNGQLASQVTLPPGPFRIDRLPVTTGLGNVQVVVRDPFGRERRFVDAFYLAQGVLRRGEQDYSYLIGARRHDEDGGPRYDEATATVFHRVGLSDSFTVGFQAEGSSLEEGGGVLNGGPLVALRPWRLGEFSWETNASREKDQTGYAHALNYYFNSRLISLIATATYQSPFYANLDLASTDRRDKVIGRWQVTVPVARLIQAGAGMFREPAIIETSRRATIAPSRESLAPFAEALQTKPAERGAFAQTTFRLGRWAQLILYAQHVTTLATKRERWDGFASLSVIIGSRSTAALTYNNEEGEETADVALQRALPFGPGWGYRVAGTTDGQSQHNGYALVEGQSRMGYAAVRYDQTSATSQGTLSADVSGSVAMMHWRPLLARSLDTSFALVQVPNGGRVRVYANNQDVGRTNRWGDLLVTDLQPYHASTFTIRDEDIPVNYELNDTDLLAALPYRGGAVLRFQGHEVRAFRGRVVLRTASGDRPPAYGTLAVDVNGTRVESPVGSDGGFYLENLPAGRYQASVESEAGNCEFEVRIPNTHQVLTDLDMIRCEPAGR